LEKILETLKTLPPKAENQRRIRIFNEFLKKRVAFVLGDRHCRGLGDVSLRFFVLTIKDHEPLVVALRKQAERSRNDQITGSHGQFDCDPSKQDFFEI
jgi:hypothetical protein